ncbi:stealth family protein [Pararhizobium antarcticum]|uniref:Capsular polysaccharide phosphotransferase SacB n=1 Tax=Pararhizobium antarcticum TaxID=1798805 RepID=A0A657LYB1_9HYPH|nr:stealth family protein [Pararhizobium antarcticum]OJF89683.1 hypothetical protein AX761_24080 [Rhizobium sp. 58]OJG00377.1 hypothetical protein AX760_25505 [Pararhizobium antarcticum]
MLSPRSFIDKLAIEIRDYLNNRYPVRHMLLARKQANSWDATFEKIFAGKSIAGVGDVLESINLSLTRPISGLKSDVDLGATSFPFIFEAMVRLADASAQTMYIYGSDGLWKNLNNARFKAWVQKPTSSGAVELAIVDASRALVSRHSIHLWTQHQSFIQSRSQTAPLKKVRAEKSIKSSARARNQNTISEIDVVYTWVNSNDANWREMVSKYKDLSQIDPDRFDQTDELKFSIRSIEMYAPWVRKVFVFSNCNPPEWFQESERVKWVMHDKVIPEQYLPTFNSHAIETFLHQISGLSENFIYFNDDFFLSGFVRPTDFFTAQGQTICRLEPYGTLPYLAELRTEGVAEEWQCAAVNGAELMLMKENYYPTQIHRHAPYAFSRSLYGELEVAYAAEMDATRSARFRSHEDFSFSSFLYHHYAINRRFSIPVSEDSLIVRHTNFKPFLDRKSYVKVRFFCLNDGGGSASHQQYKKFKSDFLNAHYPFKSKAER